MKKLRTIVAISALMLVLLLTGCGKAGDAGESDTLTAPAPAPSTGSNLNPTISLPGAMDRLNATLAEKSSVQYQVQIVDSAVADKDAYLDQLLASQKWPTAEMLVLVVFAKDNYDIRFAMGSAFQQQKVTLEEMLGLARTHYLSRAREGDPASGLADLIKAVNRRMN